MAKHIDGLTGEVFATEKAYLDHVSPVTGFTPKDLEHHGSRGSQVAKASLARKGKLSKARETALDSQLEEVKTQGVDHKLMVARR